MNKAFTIAAMVAFMAMPAYAQAGFLPCPYGWPWGTCPSDWAERPLDSNGNPACCFPGEQICSAAKNYVLSCGDYDLDFCFEFPTDTKDMAVCSYGCYETSTFGKPSGKCYTANPCGTGDSCAYIGDKRCGYVNVNGVSYGAVMTCKKEDQFGCLVWDTPNMQVCMGEGLTGKCVDDHCVTQQELIGSECTGGTGPTGAGGERKCSGDYVCYCMDRNGDGYYAFDKPTDYPTTCTRCQYGCDSSSPIPGCRSSEGAVVKGCSPTETRCDGDYVQKCSIDMGAYYDWDPVKWSSERCEFGCERGVCLGSPSEQAGISGNYCTRGETACTEDSLMQACDGDCGDADSGTWCWGTITQCASLLCSNGKCMENLGNKQSIALDDVQSYLGHPNQYYPIGMDNDGTYLYVLVFSTYSAAPVEQLHLLTVNASSNIIGWVNLTAELSDLRDTRFMSMYGFGNQRCLGGFAYANNSFFFTIGGPWAGPNATGAYERNLLRVSREGDLMSNVSILDGPTYDFTGGTKPVCGMDYADGRLLLLVPTEYSAGAGNAGAIIPVHLNGSEDNAYFPTVAAGYQYLCMASDTFHKSTCWDGNFKVTTDNDRIYVTAERNSTDNDELNYYQHYQQYTYAYIEAYGYDNYFYGKVSNYTIDPFDFDTRMAAGLTKLGSSFYLLLVGTNYSAPWSVAKLSPASVSSNECFEGSQKCTGVLNDQYVDCVRNPISGTWNWYQPGFFGSGDSSYIHTCDMGQVCEEYWVNHKLKKAQCISASCSDVCEIGQTRCSSDGTWVQTCVYGNVSVMQIGGADIIAPASCKLWNNTEYCSGYSAASYGYCDDGRCLQKGLGDECKAGSSTCVHTYVTLKDGSMRINGFVSNCTDVDGDGDLEYDMTNASGLYTFCEFGCNGTFSASSGNISYAECKGYDPAITSYRNIVAEYTQWFRILFPDEISRSVFSIVFMALVGAGLSFKSWELGLTASVMMMLVFISMGFLPMYMLFLLVGVVGIWMYKEMNA